MDIDVNRIIFRIKKFGDEFCLCVRYMDKTFIACSGSLPYVKPKFIACVKNRNLLIPVVQEAIAAAV